MTAFQNIQFEMKEGVAILTLNRPQEKNRINRSTMHELIEALNLANGNPEAGSVILTGTGEYFCAGGQIDSFPDGSLMEQRAFATAFIDLQTAIYALSKPVIAAVQGHAFAGGLSLVEACDFAVAGVESKFGLPELMAGLFPMLALAVMSKALPKKRLFELVYTGKLISAETAQEWCLVNQVVDQDKVLSSSIEWAANLRKLNPVAISIGRETYYKMVNMDFGSAIEYGKTALLNLLWTEDAREATKAATEGRNPEWKRK